MKKDILTLFVLLISLNIAKAQDKTVMLGFSASYEIFQNQASYYSNKSNNTKSSFFGLEYSESKRFLGYRAGIFYSRIQDQTSFDFETSEILFLANIFILPVPSTLEIIDFPISCQVYLPFGNSGIKSYFNLGLMASLAIFEDKTEFYYPPKNGNKSYSLRGIYGAGISYQFVKHFGLDIAVNKKRTLYTLDDNFRKPFNSLSFQTKVNYIF
ncbi:MAG: hypothetical protein ACI8P3_003268 [Saprospiraceae bacterium]|jgi:hypothetical protein